MPVDPAMVYIDYQLIWVWKHPLDPPPSMSGKEFPDRSN